MPPLLTLRNATERQHAVRYYSQVRQGGGTSLMCVRYNKCGAAQVECWSTAFCSDNAAHGYLTLWWCAARPVHVRRHPGATAPHSRSRARAPRTTAQVLTSSDGVAEPPGWPPRVLLLGFVGSVHQGEYSGGARQVGGAWRGVRVWGLGACGKGQVGVEYASGSGPLCNEGLILPCAKLQKRCVVRTGSGQLGASLAPACTHPCWRGHVGSGSRSERHGTGVWRRKAAMVPLAAQGMAWEQAQPAAQGPHPTLPTASRVPAPTPCCVHLHRCRVGVPVCPIICKPNYKARVLPEASLHRQCWPVSAND